MKDTIYIYKWGNNPKRLELKGRLCRIIHRLAKNSAIVEFENGQQECISRNALGRFSADVRMI